MLNRARRRRFSIPVTELLRDVPAWECHVHTEYTDGQASVQDIVLQAQKLGLTRLIFTEHAESWKAKTPDWFNRYVAAIRKAAELYSGDMEIVLGIEAPAVNFEGSLGLDDAMRQEAGFLLGAAHRYPEIGDRKVRDLATEECVRLEFRTLMGLANNPEIDAIAHLGGTCRQYCCEFPSEMAVEVVRTAVRNGVAIELNARHHVPLSDLFQICLSENALVTIGSDAHSLCEIGAAFSLLKTAAQGAAT